MTFIKTYLILSCLSIFANAESIPFEIVSGSAGSGQMWVRASFDKFEDRCFLDSGARISVVRATPDFAGDKVVGTDLTTGVTGNEVPVDLIRVSEIKVGPLVDLDHTVRRQPGFVVPCLVGNDLLITESLYFDFSNHNIEIDRPAAPESAFPFTHYGGKWGGFPVSFADETYQSFWDTGAGLTLVDTSVVAASPAQFTFLQEIPMGDGTGEHGKANVYIAKELKFGSYRVQDVLVIAYDLGQIRREVPTIQVVLGFNVISRFNWHIDNKNKIWSAEPLNKN